MLHPVSYREALTAVRKERKRIDAEDGRPPKGTMKIPDRERLGALVIEHLSKIGETLPHPTRGIEFVVDTVAGKLTVHYDTRFATIFSRFQEPNLRMPSDANPHTGKWNFHHDDKDTADSAFQTFAYHLGHILRS